jgi:hypothetical protein
LTTTGTLVNNNATMLYRASRHDCTGCALKLVCSPNTPARKVPRSSTRAHVIWRESAFARKSRCCPPRTHSQARPPPKTECSPRPSSNRPEPLEAGETDTDAEHAARLKAKRTVPLGLSRSRFGPTRSLSDFLIRLGGRRVAPPAEPVFDRL